jgi:predicted GNAT family acetyltransferase
MNEIINDKKGSRFLMEVEGMEVYVLYAEDKETIELYSTYTPPQLRGNRLAERVVRFALDYAKEKNLKVIPSCWYVKRFLERYPDYS